MQTRRRVVVGVRSAIVLIVFCSALSFLVGGCGSDSTNAPPTVALDPGLVDGDTVSARLSVSWTGSDPDGHIDHYEYAIDPPPAFTEEEIAQAGYRIISTVIPGSGDEPAVTRITKIADGKVVSFDWVHTKDTSHQFAFSSTQPDSGDSSATPRFHGVHALYVRAIDNDGAASLPDRAAFTSTTRAPFTRIMSPVSKYGYVTNECRQQTFRWKAIDRDGARPRRFWYKLIVPDTAMNPADWKPEVLFEDPSGWVETENTQVTLDLWTIGTYAFGVRSVDASGAVEPFLEWERNALKIQALPGGIPRVTISMFGHVIYPEPPPQYPGEESVPNEVPAGIPFRLTWSSTSQCAVDGFSWGLDLIYTDDAAPGWSSWGLITMSPVLTLSPGTHFFYVKTRTQAGVVGPIARAWLNVIAFAPDREVLLVDDSFDNFDPRDSEHDAFWHSMIDTYAATSGIPRDQFGDFSVHGDGDRGNLEPNAPRLSDLFHYKLVIWENAGWGYNSDSALIRSTALSPTLGMYLRAGGKLWLGGRATVAATIASPNGSGADLAYPITDLGPGDFAWDFLKLHSNKINDDKGLSSKNLFSKAKAFPGLPAVYDTMSVDLNKLPLFQKNAGGYTHVDAVFGPIDAEAEPGFRGDIDTVYAYGAAGPEYQGTFSPYQDKLCALRWHDPDPHPLHGRIQWFGFTLYYMKNDQAQAVFNQSLDWFRAGP